MADRTPITRIGRGVYSAGHNLIACRHSRRTCRVVGGHALRWTVYDGGRPVHEARTLLIASGLMGRILDRRAAAILEGRA